MTWRALFWQRDHLRYQSINVQSHVTRPLLNPHTLDPCAYGVIRVSAHTRRSTTAKPVYSVFVYFFVCLRRVAPYFPSRLRAACYFRRQCQSLLPLTSERVRITIGARRKTKWTPWAPFKRSCAHAKSNRLGKKLLFILCLIVSCAWWENEPRAEIKWLTSCANPNKFHIRLFYFASRR